MNIFDEWSQQKQFIHSNDVPEFYVKSREIWYVKLGQNIGNESNGENDFLRPVVVVKKVGNMFFVAPLTSKGKSDNVFYHQLENVQFKNPRYQDSSFVMLSQAKFIDKRRFFERVGLVAISEFGIVKEKLRTLIF